MNESEIQQRIQIEGPHHNCVLMRNNSGALPDKTGRIVRYGLGHTSAKSLKSSDLIGITTVTITPDMVGKTIGVFTAIEVKSEDFKWPSNAREVSQAEFIVWVKSRGGIAGFCKSVDDFKRLMQI
jgi:hypothetical protein